MVCASAVGLFADIGAYSGGKPPGGAANLDIAFVGSPIP